MLNCERRADGSIVWSSDRGRASIERLRPGVVLITYAGNLGPSFYPPLIIETDKELAAATSGGGKLTIVADCWDLQKAETEFRELWSDWLQRNRGGMEAIVAVLRSKLVVMAANVMSMVLGGGIIKTYSDVEKFEAAVQELVPGLQWKRPAGAAGTSGARQGA
jgi:hypothetical protein